MLVYSTNVIDWRIATTVLQPNDGLTWDASLWFTGYEYVDWVVEGSDIVMAVRTAYNGAHSFHDSNRFAVNSLMKAGLYVIFRSSVHPSAILS